MLTKRKYVNYKMELVNRPNKLWNGYGLFYKFCFNRNDNLTQWQESKSANCSLVN